MNERVRIDISPTDFVVALSVDCGVMVTVRDAAYSQSVVVPNGDRERMALGLRGGKKFRVGLDGNETIWAWVSPHGFTLAASKTPNGCYPSVLLSSAHAEKLALFLDRGAVVPCPASGDVASG